MTDPMHPLDPSNELNTPLITGEGLVGEGNALAWTDDADLFWREAFETRPYVPADARYEDYRGAYRYGHEAAGRSRGREWAEVEPELAAGWEAYEHRGERGAGWESVSEAVREGWQRAREALKL
ncbi:MAG TPA: hypothetical protein VFS44_00270 [Gemmatimonadaceae bacterium]|nr:hypothetical protein [Gemmatimonadaceae bacterium]